MALCFSRFWQFLSLVGGLAVGLVLFCGSGWSAPLPPPPRPTPMVVATGAVSGMYYPAGGAICRLLGATSPEIRCLVMPTGGSSHNLDLLRSGDVGFAIVRSDWQYLAKTGMGPYIERGAYEDLRAVLSLHAESYTLLARGDRKADPLNDLKGTRFAAGTPGSAARLATETLLSALGRATPAYATTDKGEAIETPLALCDKRADALALVVSHPNATVQEAMSRCALRLVGMTAETLAPLLAANPFLTMTEIPGGVYPGADAPTSTFGPRATLVTTAGMPDSVVRAVVKAVFEGLDDFRALHPTLAGLKREEMVAAGLSAPLHPAALAYYKEAGLLP